MQVEQRPNVALFLDIDGVLLDSLTLEEKVRFEHLVKDLLATGQKHNDHHLVPKTCILCCTAKAHLFKNETLHDLIDRIEKVANVHIIVSSTWRTRRTLEELQQIFHMHAFSKYIVDKTVDENLELNMCNAHCKIEHVVRPFQYPKNPSCRASQINLWRHSHPEYAAYVVLDDVDDHLSINFGNKFISTKHDNFALLTPEDTEKAYNIILEQLR